MSQNEVVLPMLPKNALITMMNKAYRAQVLETFPVILSMVTIRWSRIMPTLDKQMAYVKLIITRYNLGIACSVSKKELLLLRKKKVAKKHRFRRTNSPNATRFLIVNILLSFLVSILCVLQVFLCTKCIITKIWIILEKKNNKRSFAFVFVLR